MPSTAATPTKPRSARPRAPARTPWERLPYSLLPVTSVSEQCYCEQRVHLWLRAPSVMVSIPRQLEGRAGPAAVLRQAADAGKAFHARASEVPGLAVEMTLRQAVRSASSVVLVETPLRAQFAGLPVGGVPDAVHFENAVGRCVLDYKLTDSNQLQMGHRVQLLLYGWLLQESRVRLSDALLASVLIPKANAPAFFELDEFDRQRMAVTVHHHARAIVEDAPERVNWYSKQLFIGEDFWVRMRIFRYDRRAATKELKFFAPYWRGERPAKPSENPRKCKRCLYNGLGLCKVAAAPFEGELEVGGPALR